MTDSDGIMHRTNDRVCDPCTWTAIVWPRTEKPSDAYSWSLYAGFGGIERQIKKAYKKAANAFGRKEYRLMSNNDLIVSRGDISGDISLIHAALDWRSRAYPRWSFTVSSLPRTCTISIYSFTRNSIRRINLCESCVSRNREQETKERTREESYCERVQFPASMFHLVLALRKFYDLRDLRDLC